MMLYLEDFLEKKEKDKMDPASSADNQDDPPIEDIVRHLKSQGIFDEFRRECLSDLDTKRSYHNLIQRVTSYTSTYLAEQSWTPNINKNTLRDNLRKHINHIPMIVNGLKHLVDQVIAPKVHSLFLPRIEKETLSLSSKPEDSQTIHNVQPDFQNYSQPVQNILPDIKNDSLVNQDNHIDLKVDSSVLKEGNNLSKDTIPSQKPDNSSCTEKNEDVSKSPLNDEESSKKGFSKISPKETKQEKTNTIKDQQKENIDNQIQNSSSAEKPTCAPPNSKSSNSSNSKDLKANNQKPKPKPVKLIDISELIFDSATGSSMNNKIANKKYIEGKAKDSSNIEGKSKESSNTEGKSKESSKDDKIKKKKSEEKAQDTPTKKVKEDRNEGDEKVKKENTPRKDLKEHSESSAQKSSSHSSQKSSSQSKEAKIIKSSHSSSSKKDKHSHHKLKDEHKIEKSKPKFNLKRSLPEVDLKQIFASDSSDDDSPFFPTNPIISKKTFKWSDICESDDSSDSDFIKEVQKWNEPHSLKRKKNSDNSEDEAPKPKHRKEEPPNS